MGSVTWTVLVYVHAGDAQAGHVAQKYQDFINPPGVTVTNLPTSH